MITSVWLGLENKIIEELNVNAEFEVERPELSPIPDYSIFAEVKRTAEEQMLMRTGIQSVQSKRQLFYLLFDTLFLIVTKSERKRQKVVTTVIKQYFGYDKKVPTIFDEIFIPTNKTNRKLQCKDIQLVLDWNNCAQCISLRKRFQTSRLW